MMEEDKDNSVSKEGGNTLMSEDVVNPLEHNDSEALKKSGDRDDTKQVILSKSSRARRKCFRWTVIMTLLMIILFIRIWDHPPPNFTGDINYICQSPKVIQPWQIKAFHPKWFRLFGNPGPITYKTKSGKGHRVTVVDIDRRDIEIAMSVDGKAFSHGPVMLDNTVSCGEDLVTCLNMGFSAAIISVPPGEHVIKAEIVLNMDETFRWGDVRRRRVWWMVEECF